MRRWLFVLCVGLTLPLWFLGCTNTSRGISPDPTQMHYPIGVAVHPNGKYLYVVNANFDLGYSGGTVMVFKTTEDSTGTFDIRGVKTELKTLKQVPGATVQIGSFAGQIVINKEGTRAFVAVRQDRRSESPIDVSTITALDLDTTKEGKGHLKCSEEPIAKEDTGGVGEEDKFETDPAPRCGDDSKVFLEDNPFPYSLVLTGQCSAQRSCSDDNGCKCSDANKKAGLCTADQTCDLGKCVDVCTQSADCGSQASCQSGKCRRIDPTTPQSCNSNDDCVGGELCVSSKLYASHLQLGGLSEISIQEKDPTRRVSGISALPSGVTSLAVMPPLTPLGGFGEIFLTSRQDSNLYLLPAQLPLVSDDQLVRVPISHASTTSSTQTTLADIRGVVIGHDKKNNRVRLYTAVRSPSPAVLVYHLERIDGQLTPQLITYVPTGAGPGHMVYRNMPAPAPDLLYVVCSNEGRIDVINVETLQTIHQIKVGTQPYFMSMYEPKAGAEVTHRRAYVANFLDTTISIIDLDSHKVIGMVKGTDTRPPLQ